MIMIDKRSKKHPSGDAFLTNPIASANEYTGYGINMPLTEDEADSISEMFDDVPIRKSRLGKSFSAGKSAKSKK